MRVGILKRPAAGPHVRAAARSSRRAHRAPAAAPASRAPLAPRVTALLAARLPARHGRRGRCPRSATRKAGNRPRRSLTTSKLLDRFARDRALRMVGGIAERVEHHHGVGHGRENRAEPVFAVQPLARPRRPRYRSRAAARACGKNGSMARSTMSTPRKNAEPRGLLLRRLRRRADALRRFDETARRCARRSGCARAASSPSAPAAARSRCGSNRKSCQMERKPFRQQHDLDRHHRHARAKE